jgi:hypothetical protein
MMVLVHINAKGNDGYDKQVSFLRWSMQKYRIPAQLHVVYGEARGEYEIIKKKSESNRLYAISDFIKKRNLYNEDIIVLDPDTIFVRQIDTSKYILPVGTIRSQNYSNYIDMFGEHKRIAESVFGKGIKGTVCPFIGKGKTVSDLFEYSLYTLLGYHSKNLKSQWESGMYAIGAAMVNGKFNVIVDNFWPVANFYENEFGVNDYDGIHYGFEIPLKNGKSFKKWGSFSSYGSEPLDDSKHVSNAFIEHLKQYEGL